MPPERVPAGKNEQVALYRSLLADKQMLIVLDNARDEQSACPRAQTSLRTRLPVWRAWTRLRAAACSANSAVPAY